MNTFEKLLKADKSDLSKRETAEIESKRLAFILGEKQPVKITIQALTIREIEFLEEFSTYADGNVRQDRAIDANVETCKMGIVDPDFKSKELISHFGAKDEGDVLEKVFQAELAKIAIEIMRLSNAGDYQDEVKN